MTWKKLEIPNQGKISYSSVDSKYYFYGNDSGFIDRVDITNLLGYRFQLDNKFKEMKCKIVLDIENEEISVY